MRVTTTINPGPRSTDLERPDQAIESHPIWTELRGPVSSQMGFDDASLEAALKQHLVGNFAEFPASPAQFEGELGRLQITAPMTGPSGMTSKVTSIWGLLPDGATSLITAW